MRMSDSVKPRARPARLARSPSKPASTSISFRTCAVAGGCLFNFDAHGFHLCCWSDIDRKIGGGGVGQVAKHGAARHDDVPALARVVIVNVSNAESGLRRSKRKRNGIARPYVRLVCEGLADYDSVRITQLGKHLLDRTAREKIRAAGMPS